MRLWGGVPAARTNGWVIRLLTEEAVLIWRVVDSGKDLDAV